jgi:hypothetical protein
VATYSSAASVVPDVTSPHLIGAGTLARGTHDTLTGPGTASASLRRRKDQRDDATVPPVLVLDAGRIGRLRDVLAGGHLALEPDRRLAADILSRWPWVGGLVRGANDSYRRAAEWAVAGGTPDFPVPPAAGVIFAASGYPVGGGFHATAARARPDALFSYASADAASVMFARALLAAPDPQHVSAYPASARDPAGLVGARQAKAILERGPAMVQLQLCAQWWPSAFCEWAGAEYARLLPPGSSLALSLGIPGGAPGAAEFTADISRAGGRVYSHTEGQVARWVKAAGLALAEPGIVDVRGRELGWAAAEFGRQRPVARVVEAIAVRLR